MADFDQMLARFTTDIPYLSNWGRAMLIGPGSILDAHTDGEKIRKSELSKAVELYVDLVKAL
jgi:acetylornithine deacetylase